MPAAFVAGVVGPPGTGPPNLGVLGWGAALDVASLDEESSCVTRATTRIVTIARVKTEAATIPMISRRFEPCGWGCCGVWAVGAGPCGGGAGVAAVGG
ncbi:hypothetical protein [Mycobacterium stomatepiae]|uniref:hypothetical protein n=1 Tax=Mycobacterium stomatepiae TaxID=470076 RepID=UPI0021F32F56|nr:hypothetical protein [Mycobacterium stomatepiae]